MKMSTRCQCWRCKLWRQNLRNMDLTGKSDPFCKLSMLCHTGGEIFTRKFGETAVVKNCLDPVWNERFRLPISALQDKDTTYFIIEVYDRDNTNADDLLGSCRVFLHYASKKHPYKDAWHTLVKPSNAQGAIHVKLNVLHLETKMRQIKQLFLNTPLSDEKLRLPGFSVHCWLSRFILHVRLWFE